MLNPNTPKANISTTPKFRATLESRGAVNSSAQAENMPPKVEAMVEMLRARPGCPSLCAMGYPSRQVAAELAVPGVLIRIAVMEPP